MEVIKPRKLRKGDTIGLVAPSNPFDLISEQLIQNGLNFFKRKGFTVKFGKYLKKSNGEFAGNAFERAQDLMDMFCDNKVSAIMPILGGFNSNELLDYLDYNLIQKNPKILIGFSDITALNISIYKMTNLVTFSGPNFALFCQNNVPFFTFSNLQKALMKTESFSVFASNKYAEDKWYLENNKNRKWKKSEGYKTFKGRDFSGICIGGNLQTILTLCGTRFFPDFNSKVLFIEESNNKTWFEIRRSFVQLKQIGIIKNLKGLIIGRLCQNGHLKDKDSCQSIFEILNDIFFDTDLPIVYNVDFGHTDPIITIPIGVFCNYSYSENIIYFNSSVI